MHEILPSSRTHETLIFSNNHETFLSSLILQTLTSPLPSETYPLTHETLPSTFHYETSPLTHETSPLAHETLSLPSHWRGLLIFHHSRSRSSNFPSFTRPSNFPSFTRPSNLPSLRDISRHSRDRRRCLSDGCVSWWGSRTWFAGWVPGPWSNMEHEVNEIFRPFPKCLPSHQSYNLNW